LEEKEIKKILLFNFVLTKGGNTYNRIGTVKKVMILNTIKYGYK